MIEALRIGLPNNSHGNNSFYNVFRVSDNTTSLSVTAILNESDNSEEEEVDVIGAMEGQRGSHRRVPRW